MGLLLVFAQFIPAILIVVWGCFTVVLFAAGVYAVAMFRGEL
jgi:hypothetical protein